MLQAYLAYLDDAQGNRWASIVAGGVERVVDFYVMTQTHATTQKVRKIRLTTGVPVQWESTPAELLMQRDDASAFYVEVKDASLLQVINRLLQSTGHAWDSLVDSMLPHEERHCEVGTPDRKLPTLAAVPSEAACHEGRPRQVQLAVRACIS